MSTRNAKVSGIQVDVTSSLVPRVTVCGRIKNDKNDNDLAKLHHTDRHRGSVARDVGT